MIKNHINMFAKAKELQEGWKPEAGNRYARRNGNIEFIIGNGCSKEIAHQFFIFLPSIEQMAEMWHKKEDDAIGMHFFRRFYEWYYGGYFSEIKIDWPLPIIVLAFIQHELHGLTWSEEKGEWVDANT